VGKLGDAGNPGKPGTPGRQDRFMPVSGTSGEQFTIHHLAKLLGVSEKTLKKWEREKKIPEARRSSFGWRVYTKGEMDKIAKIVNDNGFFVKSNGNPKK
jgi:phage antirepressor YoqD-like protein